MNPKAKRKKKATKPKKSKTKIFYIIVWDEQDKDPVMVCNSLEEAKREVNSMLLEEDENGYTPEERDITSIRVYKGTLIGEPTLEVTWKE